MTATVRTFRSHTNIYKEAATRGSGVLAVGVEYAKHPVSGIGFAIVRFIALGKQEEFKVFSYRGSARYFEVDDNMNVLNRPEGLRLNKVAIPMFNPGPSTGNLPFVFAEHPGVVDSIAAWIVGRLEAEGATVTTNVTSLVQDFLNVPSKVLPDTKMVLEFPELSGDDKDHFGGNFLKSESEIDDEDENDDEGETIN